MVARISEAEAIALGLVGPTGKRKPSKYRNTRVKIDGAWWDSKGEADYWFGQLKIRERNGEIRELRRQVKYKFPVNDHHVASMVADYQWIEVSSGRLVVADFKSPATLKKRDFRMKFQLMQAVHGITVLLVGRKGPLVFSRAGRKKHT